MYTAMQNRANSRLIDVGGVRKRICRTGESNISLSTIQRIPYYKVFEYDQLDTGRYVPKIQKQTTYTSLGVRQTEVESKPDGYIYSSKQYPQGMSLLSNIQAARNSVQNPKNLGLFKLENNLYPTLLSILQDPLDRKHHLWGPKLKLKYNELDGQIKNSQNSWTMIELYSNGWNDFVDNKYRKKKNKNRRRNMFR